MAGGTFAQEGLRNSGQNCDSSKNALTEIEADPILP